MGRKKHYIPLNVFMNARHVGQFIREPGGAYSFMYGEKWLSWEHSLPISLSLPLQEDRYTGAKVMAVFDNLLPDDQFIRKNVAERIGAAGIDAFSLLSEIGRDCVGALQFLPEDETPTPSKKLTGDVLNEGDIADILSNLSVKPLGLERDRPFRISIAGAQEKTALLYHNEQWIAPSGTTPTTHILKPQIGKLPNGMDLSHSVENEYLCLELMKRFGLRAANAKMLQFSGRRVLSVERFDRLFTEDGRLIRLPQEDMCQALSVPHTQKYQNEGGPSISQIMEVLDRSDSPNEDKHDFFKANILFWLIGAPDGHAKNFSLSLYPGGRFQLSPLYDVLTVQHSFDTNQIRRRDFQLAMGWGHSNHYKFHNIYGRHIRETASACGMPSSQLNLIVDEIVEAAPLVFDEVSVDLPAGFPEEILTSIKTAMGTRLRRLTAKT